jgi:hypothetical protein
VGGGRAEVALPVGTPSQSLIDVKELIEKFSISELNEAAEEYRQRLADNPKVLAKPFNLGGSRAHPA